jgi:hypothetical protein
MTVLPGPLTSNCRLRCQPIPTGCLTKALSGTHLGRDNQLSWRNRTLQRLNFEHETLPHRQHESLESLQGRRLDPPLDPTDRILAGPRPNSEGPLAQALRPPDIAKKLPKI